MTKYGGAEIRARAIIDQPSQMWNIQYPPIDFTSLLYILFISFSNFFPVDSQLFNRANSVLIRITLSMIFLVIISLPQLYHLSALSVFASQR